MKTLLETRFLTVEWYSFSDYSIRSGKGWLSVDVYRLKFYFHARGPW